MTVGGNPVRRFKIADLVLDPNNPRAHGDRNLEVVRGSLEDYGQVEALVVQAKTNRVIAGHGRIHELLELGEEEVDAVVVDVDDAKAGRLAVVLNRSAELATWDEEALARTLLDDAELDQLARMGFDDDEAKRLILEYGSDEDRERLVQFFAGRRSEEEIEPPVTTPATLEELRESLGRLSEMFLVPPLSMLDQRSAPWQARKKRWLELQISSELGRDGDLVIPSVSGRDSTFYANKRRVEAEIGFELSTEEFQALYYKGPGGRALTATGTSVFDPVLAEVLYAWFAPRGGRIYDPFAGGSVRGIVAAVGGYDYVGVDLRPEQVEENVSQFERLAPALHGPRRPTWIVGDSRTVDLEQVGAVDLVFSCPPYFDLEVYSKDEADISSMSWTEFLAAYREIIARAVSTLRPNRFAVFVVSDVRDERGFYRGLPGETVRAFQDAGATLYNEAVLACPPASVIVRVARQFSLGRKLGRTHQNVLVFYRGDPKVIRTELGLLDLSALEESGESEETEAPAPRAVELSPVELHDRIWLKREDLFRLGEATGGKARTIAVLARGATGLVACGSRQSTQVSRAAQVAVALGLPCRVHTSTGETTSEIDAAIAAGAEVIRHPAGRLTVLKARAREDAAERGWVEVPWGMECAEALEEIAAQVANLPAEAERIVVVVGSGMTLAGILLGLERLGRSTPVLGVCVGGQAEARLTRWSPGWRARATLVRSELAYEEEAPISTWHGVQLDPVYEAKAIPYLRPGDAFWVVGIRASALSN